MRRNIYGDRVYEQKRRNNNKSFTKQDEYFHYLKLAGIFFIGYLYFHFIVMGW